MDRQPAYPPSFFVAMAATLLLFISFQALFPILPLYILDVGGTIDELLARHPVLMTPVPKAAAIEGYMPAKSDAIDLQAPPKPFRTAKEEQGTKAPQEIPGPTQPPPQAAEGEAATDPVEEAPTPPSDPAVPDSPKPASANR